MGCQEPCASVVQHKVGNSCSGEPRLLSRQCMIDASTDAVTMVQGHPAQHCAQSTASSTASNRPVSVEAACVMCEASSESSVVCARDLGVCQAKMNHI